MFIHEALVHLVLLNYLLLSLFLFLQLAVKFLSDKALSLSLAEQGLLLLLVMEEGVELLDCSPLVILSDLTVDLGPCLARNHGVGIGGLPRSSGALN